MTEVPIRRGVLAQRVRNCVIIGSRRGLCRAVARFHGLLRGGRNRRKPHSEVALLSEDVGVDLAGGTALIIRRLIVPLTAAVTIFHAGQGFPQGAFPAPLPGQAPTSDAFPAPLPGQAPTKASPFPPVNGAPAASSSFPVTGAR